MTTKPRAASDVYERDWGALFRDADFTGIDATRIQVRLQMLIVGRMQIPRDPWISWQMIGLCELCDFFLSILPPEVNSSNDEQR